MQRVYEENEKVSKRIITIPLSILQGSQTWCTMGIIKNFTCCISLFFISGSSTPNYTLLSLLVMKLLFLSAVDDIVTILFMYSTSYFITICSMSRVTLVPNSIKWLREGWRLDCWRIEGSSTVFSSDVRVWFMGVIVSDVQAQAQSPEKPKLSLSPWSLVQSFKGPRAWASICQALSPGFRPWHA